MAGIVCCETIEVQLELGPDVQSIDAEGCARGLSQCR